MTRTNLKPQQTQQKLCEQTRFSNETSNLRRKVFSESVSCDTGWIRGVKIGLGVSGRVKLKRVLPDTGVSAVLTLRDKIGPKYGRKKLLGVK